MVTCETLLGDPTSAAAGRQSRRRLVRNVGGGALATLLAAGPVGGLAARETAPGDPRATPGSMPAFFEDFLEAWAEAAATGDASPVMPFYGDEAVLEDVPMDLAFTGPTEIEPFLVGFFGNYSDASVTWRSVFATENRATAEVLFTGRYTGQIPGLPPGTGQELTTRSVHVYELGEGAIARQSLYFDAYGFLIQLGVLPAPEG